MMMGKVGARPVSSRRVRGVNLNLNANHRISTRRNLARLTYRSPTTEMKPNARKAADWFARSRGEEPPLATSPKATPKTAPKSIKPSATEDAPGDSRAGGASSSDPAIETAEFDASPPNTREAGSVNKGVTAPATVDTNEQRIDAGGCEVERQSDGNYGADGSDRNAKADGSDGGVEDGDDILDEVCW
jgi:hypothetical protein